MSGMPRKPVGLLIPPGAATVVYSPSQLAEDVVNFERFSEGGSKFVSLKSVNGPVPFEPDRGQGYQSLGYPHAIFHGVFNQGTKDVLLARFGTKLYRHCGWSRSWVELETGLNNDLRPKSPDMFVRLGELVVWCNGVDAPRVIKMRGDGRVYRLGFDGGPGAPTAKSPTATGVQTTDGYENYYGYNRPGPIGSIGDVSDNKTGWLLDGEWYYWTMMESFTGDLSPLSARSNPARVFKSLAQPWYVTDDANDINCAFPEDLQRQLFVEAHVSDESHMKGIHLFRSLDAKRNDGSPRHIGFYECKGAFYYPDQVPDSRLGYVARDNAPVQTLKIICAHAGRLAATSVEEPDIVRLSDPGLPGTFGIDSWIRPDSGGADVTAIASFNGRLIAFTISSAYDISDLAVPIPVPGANGCVAPKSVSSLPDGSLIWLGRQGFYRMDSSGSASLCSQPIESYIKKKLSRTRLVMAAARLDEDSQEYRCTVTPAGKYGNTVILCYDGTAWRTLDYGGIEVADLCVTQDSRRLLVGACYEPDIDKSMAMVFNREAATYTAPSRTVKLRSQWLRNDELAMTPMYIRGLYLCFVDSWNGEATVTFRKNWDYTAVSSATVRLYGTDENEGTTPNFLTDFAATATIGTSKFRQGRIFWRWIPVDIQDAFAWQFEITADYPTRIHLLAVAYDATIPTQGVVYPGRIPQGTD